MTQDRLAERRFVEGAGIAVAPWREVRSVAEGHRRCRRARSAAPAQGADRRLRRSGPDADRGRPPSFDDAWERARVARPGTPAPRRARARLRRRRCRSSSPARSTGPARPSRSPATATTRGSSSNRSRPAPVAADVAERATAIGATLAAAMDLCGTLTAELFLLRDGSLVVNELAPRVHNSGHWTIEGAATSQFEQHIRAICGLGLGSTAALEPDRDGQPARHGSATPGAPRRRGGRPWPTRPSTSTCTTSATSSNAARWAT